ncbi:MAG: 16S rRNA (cytosine(967)-C(5))-methyltransferase RsmB [Ruminococcaceae bacterium]|nr:16S rRNA (cytosine(967)-C(5))-methyltransferase RsmB [Oscillospiraceae bacterium]
MNSREIILKALYEIEENGGYFNRVLSDSLYGAAPSDRGFVTEIMYGIAKNKLALDHIIMQFSSVKLKKMTPWVKNILRLGIYQMYYMDKVPHSAACNESVKLSKKYAHAAAGRFINGVLRNVSRNIDNITFPEKEDLSQYLSVKYSFPLWLTDKLLSQYSSDEVEAFMAESNKPHPVNLRVNRLKTTAPELIEILKNEGIESSLSPLSRDCLTVSGKINIDNSKAYRDGLYSLQNISSYMAVKTLSPQKGEFIMDICASPGGKSCATAELMENQGEILSFDIHPHKINLIENSAKRLGIDIITASVNDGCNELPQYINKADRVILDAPCSGIGVIHKKPDIKWTRLEEDIDELSQIQKKLIKTASGYVKPGGILLYCTCTILKEENDCVIDCFLEENKEFSAVSRQQILTGIHGESGFYICKMKRN